MRNGLTVRSTAAAHQATQDHKGQQDLWELEAQLVSMHIDMQL